MARTKAETYDLKRDSITDKAAILFAEKGFSGASMTDLATICGVSKSLIYHYYAAKEDILYEVMKEHIDDLVDVINDTNHISSDPVEEFTSLTTALVHHYAGAENAQKVLLYELNNLNPAERKEIVYKERLIIKRFEGVFVRINPEMKSQTALLKSKIMLFFGMLNWMHTWYDPKGEMSRDEIAMLATNTIIGT